jgi:hypothetical protein
LEDILLKFTCRRFVIALATFLLGLTAHQLVRRPKVAPVPQTEWIESACHAEDAMVEGPLSVSPAVGFDYDPKKFNPRGEYFILGSRPKGFPEFETLSLAVDEDTIGKASGWIVIQTYLNGEYAGNFNFSGAVTEKRITIIATPVFEENVGYRFDGEFLRQGVLASARQSEAVLKGRLSKFRGGKKIAEAFVKFRVEYLGC